MTRHLGGWWRLWIVAAVIYGCSVATYTWLSWPEVSNVPHDSDFLKQMSPEALAVINRPKTLQDLEQALIAADRAGKSEDARKLAQEIRFYREHSAAEQVPLILEMPNGYEFQIAGDTKREQADVVGRDYVRVLQSIVSERRIAAVGNAFLLWFIPSILICALGLSVAWVSRGFKEETSRTR